MRVRDLVMYQYTLFYPIDYYQMKLLDTIDLHFKTLTFDLSQNNVTFEVINWIAREFNFIRLT